MFSSHVDNKRYVKVSENHLVDRFLYSPNALNPRHLTVTPKATIAMRNLPRDISPTELCELFSTLVLTSTPRSSLLAPLSQGKLASVQVDRLQGTAFISFSTLERAREAADFYNNQRLRALESSVPLLLLQKEEAEVKIRRRVFSTPAIFSESISIPKSQRNRSSSIPRREPRRGNSSTSEDRFFERFVGGRGNGYQIISMVVSDRPASSLGARSDPVERDSL